jgi:uncharacterized protein (TIGR03790 family)
MGTGWLRMWLALLPLALCAQKPENVVIVANERSAVSKSIAEYYARKRGIPAANVCYIRTNEVEEIPRDVFQREIAAPIARALIERRLTERILYIVTTLGVPLRIKEKSSGMTSGTASVDSELTLLYSDIKGLPHPIQGPYQNPFHGKKDRPFQHPEFPIYLVTRLAAYDFPGVRRLVDLAVNAVNRGKVVLDLRNAGDPTGDEWLRDAAIRLPRERVVFEDSTKAVYDQRDVIAYGSWGSNDRNRKRRFVGFQWLPGAIMTEYVSTNGRTFARPPDHWTISSWAAADQPKWFHGSPQTLSADYLQEGATGASGHVDEPFLGFCPRPDLLFPAYLSGRTLAESYYLAIPAVSWMNIVIGDPLCRLSGVR